jgi:hypothetical protein
MRTSLRHQQIAAPVAAILFWDAYHAAARAQVLA